jgi:hypothetical protein
LIVGHLNKKGGKAQYAGLGSIDIFAAARSVMTVGCTGIDENIRAIVHNKSNLAPAGKSQAFGLDPVSGFTWMGDCDTTIDEVLGRGKKPESQFAKARRFLETTLADARPVPAVEIMQMAEEQGISPATLNRAKDALGVLSTKRGTQWFWVLPIEVEHTDVTQDSQHYQDYHAQDYQSGAGEVSQSTALINMSNLINMTNFPEQNQNSQEVF